MLLVVRLYNDGVAFRYELTDLNDISIPRELTTWRIPEGMKRWMQNWTDSYEEYFPLTTTYKQAPRRSHYDKNAEGYACRWGYPALLEPVDGKRISSAARVHLVSTTRASFIASPQQRTR